MRLSLLAIGSVWLPLYLIFAAPAGADTTNPPALQLSISDAILMSLEHNPSLRVQRLQPRIVKTREDVARAAFDPLLSAGIERNRQNGPLLAFQTTNSTAETSRDVTSLQAGISQTLPTGTRLGLSGESAVTHPLYNNTASRLGVTVTQPLLQGAGSEANLAILHQTRLDTRISQFELQGYAMALVAEVEKAYWLYVQTRKQLAVFRDSYNIADKQCLETRERIRVGKLPRLEAVAADAELASRLEGVITAETRLSTARLHLIRLLNPPTASPWSLDLNPQDEPLLPETTMKGVENHVTAALTNRPDLNQASLLLSRGDLEVVRTRNGSLPRMDVFLTLGHSGYADSFDDSVKGEQAHGYDIGAGLQMEYPLRNRAAGADYRRALASRQQAEEALTNLHQLAQEDVRVAWLVAIAATTQVAAASATQTLQEQKLDAEQIRFKEGKSTSLLIAQAERDLLDAKLNLIQALINAQTSRIDLYQKDGTLLARRKLDVQAQ